MTVRRYINLGNLSLFLFIFLMVIFLGYDFLTVPSWLHIAGRFHLLILHIPIGIFIGCLVLFYSTSQQKKAFRLLFDITVLSALIAAIAGLFLAKTGEYDQVNVAWHKNLGVAFSSLMYFGRFLVRMEHKILPHLILGIGSVLLLLSGHKGAEITHGKAYLFPEGKVYTATSVCSPESTVFESMIMPIFEAKCGSCHRSQKRKGGLVLTDTTLLELGGDNGIVIDRTTPLKSTILKVISLPIKDDYHMPPEGKVQLTDQEIMLLKTWVVEGASYNKTVEALANVEIFQMRCQEIVSSMKEDHKYSFTAASANLLESVQNEYLSLQPLSIGSPALAGRFFVASEYNPNYLKDLLKVKDQLVQLDLSYMPIGENDIKVIAEFKNMEKLSLNYTPLSERQLILIEPLPELKSLSIAGLEVGELLGKFLEGFPKLTNLFLGTAEIPKERMKQWEEKFPNLTIHYEIVTKEILQLTPPAILNKKDIYQKGDSIYLTSPIPGAVIRYTLDENLPDSLKGMIYENGIPVSRFSRIKALATKDGWATSSVSEHNVFLKGLRPDSMILHFPASSEYPGEGVNTFFDDRKAEIASFKDKKWIAFREKPIILEMFFEDDIVMDSLVLSYGTHIPAYVFPPTRISLHAKDGSGKWLEVVEQYPGSIKKDKMGTVTMSSIVLSCKNIQANHFKLEIDNLSRIPSWHPGKGEKGWLFVDEIFIY